MVETWLAPVDISTGIAVSHCGFAAQGSEVHFVYRDGSNLQYRKSVDEGSTFTAAVTIGSTEEVPLTLAIAVDGKYVHVVYCRDVLNVAAPPKIYYRRSIDGGITWDGEVTLDDGTGVGNNRFVRVSLLAEAGHVHLFWGTQNGTTFVPDVLSYRRSVDNGTNWTTETTLGGSTGAGRPEATLAGSTIHLVWTDTRDGSSNNGGETYYMRSTDRGVTWNTETNMSSSVNHQTARATISAYGTTVVLAWQDPAGSPGAEDILWRYSSDGGANWSAAATLVTGTGGQEHPAVGAVSGVVALCWTDQNDTPNTTHVKLSRDGGATWSTAQAIYTPSSDTAAPTIAFSKRFLMVLDRPATEGSALARSPVFEPDPSQVILLDDFNRADDSSPPPGSSWTNGVQTFVAGEGIVIVSNQATRLSTGGYRQGGYWNVRTYKDVDFVAEISAWTAAVNEGLALFTRLKDVGSGAVDGYSLEFTHNGSTVDLSVIRMLNGVSTALNVTTVTLAANDKIALTCRGDLIVGWHRASAASEWTQLAAVLDSTYADGYVGVEFLNGQNTKLTTLWASDADDLVTAKGRAHRGVAQAA